MIDQFLMT